MPSMTRLSKLRAFALTVGWVAVACIATCGVVAAEVFQPLLSVMQRKPENTTAF